MQRPDSRKRRTGSAEWNIPDCRCIRSMACQCHHCLLLLLFFHPHACLVGNETVDARLVAFELLALLSKPDHVHVRMAVSTASRVQSIREDGVRCLIDPVVSNCKPVHLIKSTSVHSSVHSSVLNCPSTNCDRPPLAFYLISSFDARFSFCSISRVMLDNLNSGVDPS